MCMLSACVLFMYIIIQKNDFIIQQGILIIRIHFMQNSN